MDSNFAGNLERVRARIANACSSCGRNAADVVLLPVTKNHPATAVRMVRAAGISAVGENRVQEAVSKKTEADVDLRWELIGHLQSNKAKAAVDTFDRIQSVDTEKLLKRLDRIAGECGKRLPVLLEVNTGGDANKYGFVPADAASAVECALALPNLRLDGLMTVAPLDDDPDSARRAFEALRELRDRLAADTGTPLRELSMGMTDDLEEAIAAGSTCVRVGTALFGKRDYGAGN